MILRGSNMKCGIPVELIVPKIKRVLLLHQHAIDIVSCIQKYLENIVMSFLGRLQKGRFVLLRCAILQQQLNHLQI